MPIYESFYNIKILKICSGQIIYLPDLITPPSQQQVYFKLISSNEQILYISDF